MKITIEHTLSRNSQFLLLVALYLDGDVQDPETDIKHAAYHMLKDDGMNAIHCLFDDVHREYTQSEFETAWALSVTMCSASNDFAGMDFGSPDAHYNPISNLNKELTKDGIW